MHLDRSKWTETTLGEVTRIKTGKLNSNAAVKNGAFPFFTCSETPAAIDEYAYDCECVLVAGNCTPYVHYYNWKFNAYQRTYILESLSTDKLNVHWLYYWMLTYKAKLQSGQKGSVEKYLVLSDFVDAELSLPSLPEQERIVEILGAYDDLIEVNNCQMKLLEEAAQRLYVDTFITHADPTWEITTLGEVCHSIQSGGTPNRQKADFWENGTIDWYKTKELKDCWLLGSEEKITKAGEKGSAVRYYPAGTILMAIYASPTLGRLGILHAPATCNQAAVGFIIDEEKCTRWWLYYKLKEERDGFNATARGAGQQNISGEIVKSWKVSLPPLNLMQSYEQEVHPLFETMLKLSEQNVLLREARDKLLPRLLRGEGA